MRKRSSLRIIQMQPEEDAGSDVALETLALMPLS